MSLVRTGFVPIPAGAKPGFDHADVDRAGRRLYVFCPESRGAMIYEDDG